ncbi:MAG: helix-turn-helix domain-containing protein, partial [Candidatus Omnitrophica bacterium]|nr:helix-turn-helix domain-containing protein [Candidatus Omnitrophota bacterium]
MTKNQANDEEIKLRKQCVELHHNGKTPTEIHRTLNRTRDWVYKWIKRYKTGDPRWYLDESKAPKTRPTKIDSKLENDIIVESRIKLVKRDTPETQYAFHGAIAIHQELDKLGYEQKPNLST